jgi:hypothetical protein
MEVFVTETAEQLQRSGLVGIGGGSKLGMTGTIRLLRLHENGAKPQRLRRAITSLCSPFLEAYLEIALWLKQTSGLTGMASVPIPKAGLVKRIRDDLYAEVMERGAWPECLSSDVIGNALQTFEKEGGCKRNIQTRGSALPTSAITGTARLAVAPSTSLVVIRPTLDALIADLRTFVAAGEKTATPAPGLIGAKL